MKFSSLSILVVLIMVFTISCIPSKKLSYFNDINELVEPVINPREQKVIMPFDNLYISVLSIDEQTNQIFNANQGTTGAQFLISYPVDEKGNINFPFVGNIYVGGLTLSQASTKIQAALSEYVSRTSVIVRYVDNKVTILGHVRNQGVYSFSQDKINIYEAISLGGGISEYGDRKKVVLIREEGDKIMHHKLNLSDSQIASKEYFYILPNDVITVEPMKSISWYNYNSVTYTTILTTITTLMAIFVVFFQAPR